MLVTIDESSYKPVSGLIPFMKPKSIAMGKDHPLVWSHCVGKGRALYSALGHTAASHGEPKHLQLLQGAIAWAAGWKGGIAARLRRILNDIPADAGRFTRRG